MLPQRPTDYKAMQPLLHLAHVEYHERAQLLRHCRGSANTPDHGQQDTGMLVLIRSTIDASEFL